MEATERTKCEIWSRVCGYLRPIQQWNEGKEAEFHDRKLFEVKRMATEEEKMITIKKWSSGAKLTRRQAGILGHLHTKIFGKRKVK
jgi:ribonucleoside-triphosphate reductase